jgi:hypothetical protein
MPNNSIGIQMKKGAHSRAVNPDGINVILTHESGVIDWLDESICLRLVRLGAAEKIHLAAIVHEEDPPKENAEDPPKDHPKDHPKKSTNDEREAFVLLAKEFDVGTAGNISVKKLKDKISTKLAELAAELQLDLSDAGNDVFDIAQAIRDAQDED